MATKTLREATIQVSTFSPEPKARRIAKEDMPTYRLTKLGADALSWEDLLSVILNDLPTCMEVAAAIVNRWPRPQDLLRAHDTELLRIRGLTEHKIARIRAALNLAGRMTITQDERPSIHSPADAAALVLYEMSQLEQEELWIIMADTRNRVTNVHHLYKGSTSSAQVKVGEVFRESIRYGAQNIIIVHNHPSGDPTPSPDDVALTRAIVQAGNLLDVAVLDHLIIGQGRWTSLKERGLGFS